MAKKAGKTEKKILDQNMTILSSSEESDVENEENEENEDDEKKNPNKKDCSAKSSSDDESDSKISDAVSGIKKKTFFTKSPNRCGKPRKFEFYFDGHYHQIDDDKVIGKWAVFIYANDDSWILYGEEDPEKVKPGVIVNTGRMKLMAIEEGLKWALKKIDSSKVIVKIKMICKDHLIKCLIKEWLYPWRKTNFEIPNSDKHRPNHDLLENIANYLDHTKYKIMDAIPTDEYIFDRFKNHY